MAPSTTPTPASNCQPTASGWATGSCSAASSTATTAASRRRRRHWSGLTMPAPNAAIRTILSQPLTSSALLPAGNDSFGVDDAPLAHLLDDVRTEAARLSGLDTAVPQHRRGAHHGRRRGHAAGTCPRHRASPRRSSPSSAGRRVPIYVIAIAPPVTAGGRVAGDRHQQRRALLRDHQGADRPGGGQRRRGARDGERHHGRRAARLRAAHRLQHRADGAAAVRPAERVPGDQPDRRHGEPEERRRASPAPRCPTPTSPTRPAARRSRSAATS